MDKGTLVEFRHHNNDRLLAIVTGTEGKKNLLLSVPSGQTHSVHPRQITFSLPSLQLSDPQQIPSFLNQVEPLLDPDALEVAWELLSEDRQAHSLADIAQILFSETAPEFLFACYRLLSEDKVYFKQKGDAYEPRTPAQVQEIQHQLTLTRQREQEQAEFEAHLRQALTESTPIQWTPAERSRLESLERYALHGEETSDRAKALQILTLVGRPGTELAAFNTLVELGIWSPHENLALRRTGIPTHFTPEHQAATQTILDHPPEDLLPRQDLTALHTYTIDDASTRDIDDALSVEWRSEDQIRIWVHIADPTRWIPLGHPLETEARRRGTSVYLPEQVIPMFPPELSTGPMSLVQGQVREALSFGIDLTPEGAVADSQICASRIKVSYRLTYEDADEMLELGAERELTALNQAAQQRYHWRQAQGAIAIAMPEQDIKVNADHSLIRVIEDTPSRQLVAEMMILVGEVAAQFCSQHQIPVPYRAQPAPELPPAEDLAQLPPGPVYSFALMRCMQRAEMSLVPGRHTGLGLSAYTQATSPIRRYTDLLTHFQIKAALQGQVPPFTTDQVQHLIAALDPTSYEAIQVERKTKRYWSLEFLRQYRDRSWHALVLGYLREHENLALVMIDEIAFRIPVRFTRSVDLGEWVELEVAQVDPHGDVIDFRESSALTSDQG